MPKRTRLTEAAVKSLEVPDDGYRITYDAELSGFGVRVTKSGNRSFVLNYRFGGREKRLTIGAYPTWSVSAARKEAKRLRLRIDTGEDPLETKRAVMNTPTMLDLCDRYIEVHLPRKRPSSQRDDLSMIKSIIIPALGDQLVKDLSYEQVERLHTRITRDGAPYRANRMVALLSKMLSLSIRWGWRTGNPACGIEKNQEQRRERYLSPEEIQRLVARLDAEADQTQANAVRLLLLTGARKTEVLSAIWKQFDLTHGIWTKPSSHTKQKRSHRVPISEACVNLLKEMKRSSKTDYLFPSRSATGHVTEMKKFWQRVCAQAELNDLRIH